MGDLIILDGQIDVLRKALNGYISFHERNQKNDKNCSLKALISSADEAMMVTEDVNDGHASLLSLLPPPPPPPPPRRWWF